MSKLLVVDDEYRIRQIIKKYAEFEGYEVEEAVDGMRQGFRMGSFHHPGSQPLL